MTTLILEATPLNLEITADQPTLDVLADQVTIDVTVHGITTTVEADPLELSLESTVIAPIVTAPTLEIVTVAEQGPPGAEGPAGPGNDIVLGEEPTGVINGSNATFTTDHDFVPGTVVVRVNGLSQRLVTDFQTSGTNTITFTDSPLPGDHLAVDYERA